MQKYTLQDFIFDLPAELIAQKPTPARTASRLLVVKSTPPTLQQWAFNEVTRLLQPNDLLVINDTRVIPARLRGHKATGGAIELLLERFLPQNRLLAQIRASKSPPVGSSLVLPGQITATVRSRQNGFFELQLPGDVNPIDYFHTHGHIPLPPYITRTPEKEDLDRYQTVFGQVLGAVAAPTAGLHFDQALLDSIKTRGIRIAALTLHVGAGTFQPIRVNDLSLHQMHHEYINVNAALCAEIAACRARQGRVIAVGTTVVRALETWARCASGVPYEGETDIFITPGFDFRVVDALITNFHLPQSTLLMLVCAFGGYERMMEAYRWAVAQRMRFFSYGDAMWIPRAQPDSGHF